MSTFCKSGVAERDSVAISQKVQPGTSYIFIVTPAELDDPWPPRYLLHAEVTRYSKRLDNGATADYDERLRMQVERTPTQPRHSGGNAKGDGGWERQGHQNRLNDGR